MYPLIIQRLPIVGVYYDRARFSATMNKAVEFLRPDVGMKVFNAWFERIDLQLRSGMGLGGFEFGILSNLIEFTKKDYVARTPLFEKLINYEESSLCLYSLKWAVGYWTLLHDNEKGKIMNMLDSNRSDQRWIRAQLLTVDRVPGAIQEKCFGDGQYFERDVADVLEGFDEHLLEDCLQFFVGESSRIHNVNSTGANQALWAGVMTYILTTGKTVGFRTSLREFLMDAANTFPQKKWIEPALVWRTICATYPDKKLLLETLIYCIG